MKKNIMSTKYIWLLVILIGFTACNEIEDVLEDNNITTTKLPELTTGTADFSNYVSLGASFTSGYSDGTVFMAGQENSFPNILSKEFAKAGGGDFTQPLVNDNIGGLLFGGMENASFGPRFYFYSDQDDTDDFDSGPYRLGIVPHEMDFTPEIPTTETLNIQPGPYNNMGVPGAKSFHMLFDGLGNPANLATATANPYFVRMASSPSATMLGDAMAQNPTFFTLSEVGGNDVLLYATSGGDGSNAITDTGTFDFAFNTLVSTLTSGGAKGAVTNVPYITDLPHFTAVPHAPLSPANPSFGPLIPTLNGVFGQINQVFAFLESQGVPNATERSIVFSQTSASPVVIYDENLDNLSAQMTGVFNASPSFPGFVQSLGLPAQAAPLVATLLGNAYGQSRQATENDLLVLPSSSIIGEVNSFSYQALLGYGLSPATAAQFSINGITLPLTDKWVLLPSEQLAIKEATDAYNTTIASVVNTNENLALVDLNSILTELASTGIEFEDYTFNANLVTGGAISLDGIHLTARGYSYMAYRFLEAIDTSFGSNFIDSGNTPNPDDYPTNYSSELR